RPLQTSFAGGSSSPDSCRLRPGWDLRRSRGGTPAPPSHSLLRAGRRQPGRHAWPGSPRRQPPLPAARRGRIPARSENQSQAELDFTRRVLLRTDGAKTSALHLVVHAAELVPVEYVEHRSTEFDAPPLVKQREILADVKVLIDHARSPQPWQHG